MNSLMIVINVQPYLESVKKENKISIVSSFYSVFHLSFYKQKCLWGRKKHIFLNAFKLQCQDASFPLKDSDNR